LSIDRTVVESPKGLKRSFLLVRVAKAPLIVEELLEVLLYERLAEVLFPSSDLLLIVVMAPP